jgi:hypothetical protein
MSWRMECGCATASVMQSARESVPLTVTTRAFRGLSTATIHGQVKNALL